VIVTAMAWFMVGAARAAVRHQGRLPAITPGKNKGPVPFLNFHLIERRLQTASPAFTSKKCWPIIKVM
jgi:hypothetical protein